MRLRRRLISGVIAPTPRHHMPYSHWLHLSPLWRTRLRSQFPVFSFPVFLFDVQKFGVSRVSQTFSCKYSLLRNRFFSRFLVSFCFGTTLSICYPCPCLKWVKINAKVMGRWNRKGSSFWFYLASIRTDAFGGEIAQNENKSDSKRLGGRESSDGGQGHRRATQWE